MRKTVKYIVSKTIKPFVARYLRKPRFYKYEGILLEIAPEVFHPGLFFSTKLLLRHLLSLDIQHKTLLELGAGSGLISFRTAQNGAIVTATDINNVAVAYLGKNKKRNNSTIDIIQSDLYESIPAQPFDIIAVNPPYYKKDPQTEAEHAWYCGIDGSYFSRFFRGLDDYIKQHSIVLMVLSEDCDITMIKTKASENNFTLNLVKQDTIMWETLYIFEIKKTK